MIRAIYNALQSSVAGLDHACSRILPSNDDEAVKIRKNLIVGTCIATTWAGLAEPYRRREVTLEGAFTLGLILPYVINRMLPTQVTERIHGALQGILAGLNRMAPSA